MVAENFDQHPVTVAEILERYRSDCFPKLAPRTAREYVRHLGHLNARFGTRVAGELKPRDFGPFLQERANRRGQVQRVRQLAVLSAAFTHAVSFLYVMDRNPLREVKRPKSQPRTRYVTHAEYDGVRAIALPQIRLAMELAYLTGQRQGDVIGLRWKDVDERVHFIQGKTGKKIGVKIGPKLEKTLDDCWQLPNGGHTGSEWVVPRGKRGGGRYTSEGFRAGWQRTIGEWVRLGNERWNFHDLRAKCVSDSKSLQEASDRAGHIGQQMTKRVYDRKERQVDSLA